MKRSKHIGVDSRYHAWPVHLKRDMSYTLPLCLWNPKTFMYLKIYRKKVAIGYWNLHTLGYPFTGFPTSQRLSNCNPGDKKCFHALYSSTSTQVFPALNSIYNMVNMFEHLNHFLGTSLFIWWFRNTNTLTNFYHTAIILFLPPFTVPGLPWPLLRRPVLMQHWRLRWSPRSCLGRPEHPRWMIDHLHGGWMLIMMP